MERRIAQVSRIGLLLAKMRAAGLRLTARPTQPTMFEHAYGYDDHRLGRGAATTAEPVALIAQGGPRSGSFDVFDAYDKPRGQVPHTVQKFTGKERDAETGLDWFGTRYMYRLRAASHPRSTLTASSRGSGIEVGI